MIVCAQCGKKNKDNATECKYCGYNPSALQQSNAAWGYQNGAYPPMQYQPPIQQTTQHYYDANGKAYNVRYDYKVTPVEEDEEEEGEEGTQQMTLYPYNPTLVQQQPYKPSKARGKQTQYNPYGQQSYNSLYGQLYAQKEKRQKPEQSNIMAWIAYFLAMFFDVLAWPFCWIGLAVASRRDGSRKELCNGGMLFTFLRVLSVLILGLLWWGTHTYLPEFFVGIEPWKEAVVKIVLFGWPIAIGSIFMGSAPSGSGLEAAGRGYFYFSIVLALLGIIFFDVTWLPIFT